MPHSLQAEIEIQASPEQVWDVLTDFAAYGTWNPFIVRAAGQPVVGGRLELQMRHPGRRPTTFRPRVLEADPGRRLRWLGRLMVPGVFDGDHRFSIHATGPDRVRLVQREEFRGLLAPLLLAFIARPTEEGFRQMNRSLKAQVERPAHRQTTP
jgi:hypothetical protein